MMNQAILDDDDNESEEEQIATDQERENDNTQFRTPQNKGFFLEISLICLFFANNLPSTLLQNQILKQTCQSQGYNETICDEISKNTNETKDVEIKLQKIVAEIFMTNNLINTFTTAFLSLFLGPFSDKFGRKKILNSTFLGFSLTLVLFGCIAYYSENVQQLSPWAYTFAYIPQILSGGWPSLLTSTLCYITDTTDESNRAFRLTIVEAIIFCGVLLGNMACNLILPYTDTVTVFVISGSSALLATVIMMMCVEESVNSPATASTCEKIKSLFSPHHFMEMLRTCFKRRSFKERRILLCLITMLTFTVLTYNGTASVAYLFERKRFGWELQDHNLYESCNIIVSITGCLIGISVLKKIFKFSDMTLIFISLTSGIFDSSLKAFAFESWQMYAISCIALFRILASPLYRTLISVIIPAHEIGKIFAITTSFEAITALIASPLYTIVYTKTLTFLPGAFFLITASVYSINLMLSIFVKVMKSRRESLLTPYAIIENE
jgi:MFS transporter, PCFT/HCP family, solute carrier family 46 (folate transporter), member 1